MIIILDDLDNKGVSPVVGVILMVAVTVALVGLVTVVVLDITGEQKEPAETVLNGQNNKLTVLRNQNVDTYYANGLVLPDNNVGTTVQPIPDKQGNVRVIAGVDNKNQVIQNFEMTPVEYDVSSGDINIEFDNGIITLEASESVTWDFGVNGDDYTLYKCTYYDGEIYTFTDNPHSSCSEVTNNPTTDELKFTSKYPDFGLAFTAKDSSDNIYGTGGIAQPRQDETTYTFTNDTAEDPLIGYNEQIVEFEFRDESNNNLKQVNWEVVEENGAGINRTAPDNEDKFKAKLLLDNPDEQGNFVIESSESSTGDVVDKKRVVVLPYQTDSYTYSSDSNMGGNNGDKDYTITGQTSINPNITGATVKAVSDDGSIVATDTTNSTGEYKLEADNVSRVVLEVDGFTHTDLSAPLYGTASKSVNSEGESTVDFVFSKSDAQEIDADKDGSDELIATELEDKSVIQIGTVEELQAIQDTGLNNDYVIVDDIDASATDDWSDGFNPITNEFKGTIKGNHHTIKGLYINNQSVNRIGLFRNHNGVIKNVTFKNADITGKEYAGVVSGESDGVYENITIKNSDVHSNNGAGLLTGYHSSATIKNITVSGKVTSDGANNNGIGGVVGSMRYGTIRQAESDVNVTLLSDSGYSNNAGGIVGEIISGSGGFVINSSSKGEINGEYGVGGIVGSSDDGKVIRSYSGASVDGYNNVGGVVGRAFGSSNIRDSFAYGSVTADDSDVGGVIGDNSGSTSDSYWDTDKTGQSSSAGFPDSNGLSTSEMQGSSADSNMNGLDFTDKWNTVTNDYPDLIALNSITP